MSQIHQELETLKKELKHLDTVRQNFEEARQVTTRIVEQLATQSEKLHDHIGNVIPIYDKHLQENLKQTQDKLALTQKNIQEETHKVMSQWKTVADDYQTGLYNHIEMVQKQLEDSQKGIESRLFETSIQWKTVADDYKTGLSEHIERVQERLEYSQSGIEYKTNETIKRWKEVADNHNTSLAEHLKKLQNEFEKSGKGIQKNVSDATMPISDLNKRIENLLSSLVSTNRQLEVLTTKNERLVDEIRKIDFPSRLDKIDNTVSAINLGLQNVQLRLSDTERNMKESIMNLNQNVHNQMLVLESKANSAKKFQWVTLFLLCVAIAMLVAIYLKK
jgi:ABC-type transporter Mla subunit MlaD